ncbi:MAG: bifunctional transcriptional activator/DNA repair protein Ada [Planctomycetes bacterium]|nr:bifunctional transcriptional activator/DNA repair protein Ada [Planctomycetota bacterium]
MFDVTTRRRYYQALLDRNSEYDGVVYFGIRTTGIFCRAVCTARKPKFENCEFFYNAQEALLAGYRPCKRCLPMSLPDEPSPLVRQLVEAIESAPEKRWTNQDFHELGVDSSTVRRQFKKRFGMTFVAYARARRMGSALQTIRNGSSIIDAQLEAGYESGSGFRDAFSKFLGVPPKGFQGQVLKSDWIDTPLGPMLAVASDEELYLLEFTDRRGLERNIERLRLRTKMAIVPGQNEILCLIRKELKQYFQDGSRKFTTPVAMLGTEFQKSVWQELCRIPSGETRSYSEQARRIGSPDSVRAVAHANGANQTAIIVPCHRVVGFNGDLTGYAGGLAHKQWLIDHERK